MAYYGKHIEFENIRINSGMILMRGKQKEEESLYIYFLMKSTDIMISINNYISGSAQPQLPLKDIVQMPIIIPEPNLINLFTEKIQYIQNDIDLHSKDRRLADKLLHVILSKMAKA